jgi:hypothetical protein
MLLKYFFLLLHWEESQTNPEVTNVGMQNPRVNKSRQGMKKWTEK